VKPAPFRYDRPATLAALLRLIDDAGPEARIIAGGQSLGPMLNLRVVQPGWLIDITAVPELKRARRDGDVLVIGACVTHADIEDGRIGEPKGGPLARIARGIAYRAVRNRGTIGGSLCHADPAADWVTTLPALGASVELASAAGTRLLPVEAFVTGALTTALQPGEILTAVRVPISAPRSRFGYVKSCRKLGEFSKASAAILAEPEWLDGRVVLGAIEQAPRCFPASALLTRSETRVVPRADTIAEALVAAGIADPVRRHIHAAVLARAVAEITA